MDDLVLLGLGRTIAELSAQREQLLQHVKQLQAQAQEKRPETPPQD